MASAGRAGARRPANSQPTAAASARGEFGRRTATTTLAADGDDATAGDNNVGLAGRLDSESGRGDDDGRGPGYNVSRALLGPLPEGVRAADDVGLKGGGGDDGDNGRRACNAVGRTGHVASLGGGEGR